MGQLLADRTDIDFVLHEQFKLADLSGYDRYSDFTKPVIDMIVSEVRSLAIKEILPTNEIGDKQGCTFENGNVFMPDGFKEAWQRLQEGEWFAPSQSIEWGGQGIPNTLNVIAQNYLFAANLSLLMVAGLNHAAGKIIETFGTERQKQLYLRKLYAGQWSGTMLLTEAESGSDLGGLTTTATRHSDGSFRLSGSKVFISGGDQDMTDNIVHLILARIEGAPEGSRGISLFVAPKYLVDETGAPSERNDITCTGIEEKMGLHGSPTCTMALGSRGECVAELVGEENRGLAIMFLMMNKARLMVGSQGLACASSAYQYALDYARTRIQGARIADPDKVPAPIIAHPDIRRMLLSMKAYTEGCRSLLCYIANLEDRKRITDKTLSKSECQDLIDILIPVAKAYVTDRAVDVCNMAVQIYGGYGYTSEFPVSQLLRDVRITTIYEGTNGIQAMDLLGRKMQMAHGRLYRCLRKEMEKSIEGFDASDIMAGERQIMTRALEKLDMTSKRILSARAGNDLCVSSSFASQFLEVFGDIMMAWMLLWRADIAGKRLQEKLKKKQEQFYSGQIKTAQFFFNTILPVSFGRMAAIENMNNAAVTITDSAFGGK